jgi:hypothetical protein
MLSVPLPPMESLDKLIRDSLVKMARFNGRTGWRGREREAVSLYAFGFLVPDAGRKDHFGNLPKSA